MALTEHVKREAGNWWAAGGGKREDAPISIEASQPECFEAPKTSVEVDK